MQMAAVLTALILVLGFAPQAKASSESTAEKPVFRLHLFTEPMHLDPQTTAAASGNYVFHNLYRGLYSWHGKTGLKKEGAESCTRKNLKITCKLAKTHKWSNGERVKAQDYVHAFRRLIDPKNVSPQADVIFGLKNAREIWDGKKSAETLGISSEGDYTLVFELTAPDSEFEYRLIHPALSPDPKGGYPKREEATSLITSGPYTFDTWKRGYSLKLKPNPYYPGHPKRPEVEAFFVDEDSTALNMYMTGKLSFNRRITASEIPNLKRRKDFFQTAMARFDYIGFGPQLKDQAKLREALVTGVELEKFLELFDTKSPPGCPSLPASYFEKMTCLKQNPKAKDLVEKSPKKMAFQFSRMGGDDIARAVEWFQNQWKKNLGIDVELKGMEQGVYVRALKNSTPPIFRKGVSLDRPTCLAGLEVFTKDNPENYIQLEDATFETKVEKLRHTSNANAKKRLCKEALEHLIKTYRLMFLGEMHFTMLASPEFTGWNLNELNQLDLSQLRPASGP